jgi:elongation factor G
MVNIDPFKGRLGTFRIHQGTIKPGNQLFVGDARKPIKVNQLLKVNGETHSRADVGVPGDICAIPRVEDVHFDAVLHDSHDEDHFHLKSIDLPNPMYGLAIKPQNDADAQRTSDALHAVVAEDPSLVLEHNAALNEIVLRGMGELHLRTILEQILDRYNLEVVTALPSIAYRETITAPAEGHHRHKKQTGGAGQFGEVYLRIAPRPAGSGFEFKSAVVGGAIPTQYIPAVETGVKQAMESHSVDSKEIAFVQAGKKAFMDAVGKARPIVMEPIVDVTFTIPTDCAGGVTGDLSSRDVHHSHRLCRRRHGRSFIDARHGDRHRDPAGQPHGRDRPGAAQGNPGLSLATEITDRRRRQFHHGLQSLRGGAPRSAGPGGIAELGNAAVPLLQ